MTEVDWVVYKSPLWHKDNVQDRVKPLPDSDQRTSMEKLFINDAIKTQVYHYPRKKPIIPVYTARKDKFAQSYFQSPLVKSLIRREKLSSSEMRAREMLKEEKNLNKLSHRHRVQRTPNVQDIRAREEKFTNDAIVTERRRTRFKDIIPQYDASSDRHCKAYFKRKDVQRLLDVTCSREENEWLEDYLEKKRHIYHKYSLFSDSKNKSDKENNSEGLPPPEV